MTQPSELEPAGGENPRRVFVYNGGFLTQPRIKRILELAGWHVSLGKPGADDWVGVWGRSPTSPRGEAIAHHTESPILRVEDSFLRSVLPGRSGEPPIGLTLDTHGVHFDSAPPSDLEILLATHPLDDTILLNRARAAIDHIKDAHLSKYNAFDPTAPLPKAPYVLVIDQTKGDASIEYGAANAATFHEMLVFAQTEHPGNRVIIKSHPESAHGGRQGHFGPQDENGRVSLWTDPVSPWALMEGATAVYTVSSQLGFEAIFAGHKPRVFGQPFYSGWGLTADENPVARRERKLTRAQLFAAAMILYPKWYDPFRDRLCSLEDALTFLEAGARAWREDRHGYNAIGMSRWKRRHLNQFFGAQKPVSFSHPNTKSEDATSSRPKTMVWASKENALPSPPDAIRVEDGFLRSRGLGAKLIPPLSLVRDDLGIYYDPTRESRLERLIAASATLSESYLLRAGRLRRQIIKSMVTKYNLGDQELPEIPPGHRILVAGQVEDDASILKGCGDINTNQGLLEFVRNQNPDAILIYKPHPDVQAGLRKGAVQTAIAESLADVVTDSNNTLGLIDLADEVWSMTSLLGFEALIRNKSVACVGTPFYAGWGLTKDFGAIPDRRQAKPSLNGLVYAALIQYPRYFDYKTGLPCPAEVAVERLASGNTGTQSSLINLMARMQSLTSVFRRFHR